MSTELIERLRAATMRTDWNNLPDDACIPAVPILREAADHISALADENARLVKEVEVWAEQANKEDDCRQMWQARATAAESDRETLRVATIEKCAKIAENGPAFGTLVATEIRALARQVGGR
ncbi:hypothetical protein NKH73_13945 [Mesorhizobium sp. M0938]|uniref:hypothetical protein n=1 Tax=unclassified Mesorhizobium TaxID=325217 RepID=UPI003339BF41